MEWDIQRVLGLVSLAILAHTLPSLVLWLQMAEASGIAPGWGCPSQVVVLAPDLAAALTPGSAAGDLHPLP